MTDASRKLAIYREILFLLLPHARSEASRGRWRRFWKPRDLRPELELVHNIPPLLAHPQVRNFDVHWLNTQARIYRDACRAGPRAYSGSILRLIAELQSMVPPELHDELIEVDVGPIAPVILDKPHDEADARAFLQVLGAADGQAEWHVFHPRFIRFATEAEHEAREIKHASGYPAFRLSGSGIAAMAEAGALGFDWTDLSVSRLALADGTQASLYLQCIDAGTWHAEASQLAMIELLRSLGFRTSGLASLPFPKQQLDA